MAAIVIFRLAFAVFFVLLTGASYAGERTPLRIATFNVKWMTATARETRMAPWKSEAELADHRRRIAAILAEIRPDIAALQEVTSRAALEKLAAEPSLRIQGYRVLHVESEDRGTGQDVVFLVGPRVRLDTLDHAVIRRFADTLPGRPARLGKKDPRRQRLTKHALVCFSKPEKLCVLGLHLLAHPDDRGRTSKRETQARIAAALVRTEIVAKGYLPIVLGDFNDFDPAVSGTDHSGENKRKVLSILKDVDLSRPGSELVNAATLLEPPEDRWSVYWDKDRDGVKDSTEPVSLMDHILVDARFLKRITKVFIPHAVQDGSVSDHWPVVVEIKGN